MLVVRGGPRAVWLLQRIVREGREALPGRHPKHPAVLQSERARHSAQKRRLLGMPAGESGVPGTPRPRQRAPQAGQIQSGAGNLEGPIVLTLSEARAGQ
eukprot:8729825-Pyramimonas_sp.AAC.1